MSGPASGILACPVDVVCDALGNVWIADCEHQAVIGIDGRGEVIARVDGSPDGAGFRTPRALALAPDGNTLHVLDGETGAVCRVDVTASRAPAETMATGLDEPRAMVVDHEAGWLYIATANDGGIQRIAMAEDRQAHGGRAGEALLSPGVLGRTEHMALSSDRRRLYVVDGQPRSVRVIDLVQGEVSTLAALPDVEPESGPGDIARQASDAGMAITVTPAGLMVADPVAAMLYGINPRHGTVVPIWRGDRGDAEQARPTSVAFDRMTRTYVVADPGNHRLLRVSRDAQSTRVIAVSDPAQIAGTM